MRKRKIPHLIVLGTSGSGKTETLKSIIHELNLNKVPSLVTDFHNEFLSFAINLLNLRMVGIALDELKEKKGKIRVFVCHKLTKQATLDL